MPNRRIRGSHTTTGCSPTPQMTLLPGSRFKLVELLGRSAVRGVRPARCPGNWPRHSITAHVDDWSRALSTFEIAPPSGARANFLEVFPNIPCLKRHEVNGNYYAIKKIRSKIKTYALRSESRTAITDRKLAGRTLRECLVWEREDELSTLRAFFQIIGQPICRDSSPVLHVSNTRRF